MTIDPTITQAQLTQEGILEHIQSTLEGDHQSFDVIVDHHWRLVWYVVTRFVLDPERAEEMVQITFVKAFQNLKKWEPSHSFSSWLSAIARNECLNHVRNDKNQIKNLKVYAEFMKEQKNEKEVGENPRVKALGECLKELDGLGAKILRLFYHDRISFEEISKKIDRSLDATRKMASRLRNKLKGCVERKTESR